MRVGACKGGGMKTQLNIKSKVMTIEEVVENLDRIVDYSTEEASRLGYFATLYRLVTITVKNHIKDEFFQNNELIGRLDVIFANMYFKALYDYMRKDTEVLPSWSIAFNTAKKSKLTVYHHMLLGVNAHIIHDLGVASAKTWLEKINSEPSYNSVNNFLNFREDFEKVNSILFSILDELESAVKKIFPLYKILDNISFFHKKEQFVIRYILTFSRSFSWSVCADYIFYSMNKKDVSEISMKASKQALFFSNLLRQKNFFSRILSLGQSSDIRKNVKILGACLQVN